MDGYWSPDRGFIVTLEEVFRDLAVLRTTAETRALFPLDEELWNELRPGAELARARILALLDWVDEWIRSPERAAALALFRDSLQPFVCGPGQGPCRGASSPCYRLRSDSAEGLASLSDLAFTQALLTDFRAAVAELEGDSVPETEQLYGKASALLFGVTMAEEQPEAQ